MDNKIPQKHNQLAEVIKSNTNHVPNGIILKQESIFDYKLPIPIFTICCINPGWARIIVPDLCNIAIIKIEPDELHQSLNVDNNEIIGAYYNNKKSVFRPNQNFSILTSDYYLAAMHKILHCKLTNTGIYYENQYLDNYYHLDQI